MCILWRFYSKIKWQTKLLSPTWKGAFVTTSYFTTLFSSSIILPTFTLPVHLGQGEDKLSPSQDTHTHHSLSCLHIRVNYSLSWSKHTWFWPMEENPVHSLGFKPENTCCYRLHLYPVISMDIVFMVVYPTVSYGYKKRPASHTHSGLQIEVEE